MKQTEGRRKCSGQFPARRTRSGQLPANRTQTLGREGCISVRVKVHSAFDRGHRQVSPGHFFASVAMVLE